MDNTGKRQHARYYAAEGQDDVLLRQRSRISSRVALSARLWPFAAGLSGGAIWPLWLGVPAKRRRHAGPAIPLRHGHPALRTAVYHRSGRHAEVLLIGAILAPGTRTVASLLRISGLMRERHFVNYHRVLNRAAWSPRLASRLLLRLLIETFAPNGPVVLGLDDTIERRCRSASPPKASIATRSAPATGILSMRPACAGSA